MIVKIMIICSLHRICSLNCFSLNYFLYPEDRFEQSYPYSLGFVTHYGSSHLAVTSAIPLAPTFVQK